jgi:hypothetical protein
MKRKSITSARSLRSEACAQSSAMETLESRRLMASYGYTLLDGLPFPQDVNVFLLSSSP